MKVFITGASGYIGGSIAARLIAAGHAVTGLVRSATTARKIAARGIEPVIGSLDDARLLAANAERADAVVNAADSDHRGAVEALIGALRGSGKALLHTSGSSIVGDDARGEPSNAIFTEDTAFVPAPAKAARVAIGRLVREAADDGVRAIVLCNTLIYGHGLGLHRDSVQIPALADQARRSGVARYIGRGLNIWSNVHIDDVAALYLLALDRAPGGSFYFVENGEASFRDMVEEIAGALGLGPAQGWGVGEAIAAWGLDRAVFALGSNSRVRAERARRELGWAPKHASVLDWIGRELARPPSS
jgi:nucleoside-diphosphate-sugar epimerase